MKKLISILLILLMTMTVSDKLFAQSTSDMQEFGIGFGGFSNFTANQNYLTDYSSAVYLSPYIRTGRHEFSAGFLYPLTTNALFFTDNKISPCMGAIAGYKFYVFNVYGRENMFVHYAFEYMRYKGKFDTQDKTTGVTTNWTETNMYINNVFGLGYNVFFDTQGRFGFYYTLDYVISQTSYKVGSSGYKTDSWATNFVWNNLSNNIGFIFKITSLKKKEKK
jgi:hypothetical protein